MFFFVSSLQATKFVQATGCKILPGLVTSNQSSTKKTLNVRQQQPQTVEGSNNKNVKENSKDDKTSANGNSGVTRCDWHAREEDKNGKFIPEGKICKFINSL